MKRNTVYTLGAFTSTLSAIYCLSTGHITGFILFLIPVTMFCNAMERGRDGAAQRIGQEPAQDRNQQ